MEQTGQIDSRFISRSTALPGTQKAARANAIGISRGGGTTKIHALVDVLGRPLRLVLAPGNTSDVKAADLLIGGTIGMKRVIADRGYDANRIRATLRDQGTIPVIPGRRSRKRSIPYGERRFKDRWGARPCSAASKTSAHRYPLRQTRQELPNLHKPRCPVAFWL